MSIKVGGTPGGFAKFVIGLSCTIGGLFLLLKNMIVQYNFGWNSNFRYGQVSLTSGYLLLPFIIGVGMIFYNGKNPLGWLLMIGSIMLLIIGVITSINFTMAGMSAFDIILILALLGAGLGLLLSSIRIQQP